MYKHKKFAKNCHNCLYKLRLDCSLLLSSKFLLLFPLLCDVSPGKNEPYFEWKAYFARFTRVLGVNALLKLLHF